jgi:hypothetical protein
MGIAENDAVFHRVSLAPLDKDHGSLRPVDSVGIALAVDRAAVEIVP